MGNHQPILKQRKMKKIPLKVHNLVYFQNNPLKISQKLELKNVNGKLILVKQQMAIKIIPNSIRYPRTPDKREHISKRAWDARIRRWRRQLHLWDPPGAEASPRKTPFKQGSAPNSSSKSNRKRKPNPSSTIKKSKPVDISNSEQFPSL